MPKKGLQLPLQLRLEPIINKEEENTQKWKKLWEEYDFLNEYYNLNEISDKEINLEGVELYGQGTFKIIKKININEKIYAIAILRSNDFDILYNEIKNHLQILKLYYQTYEEYKWSFKIPKIYKVLTEKFYIMDFININEDSRKFGKIYSYIKDEKILSDIGKFLALYLINYKIELYDFELYYTVDGDVYMLDFGVFNNIFSDEKKLGTTLPGKMYDSLTEILLKNNFTIEEINKFYVKEQNFVDFNQKYEKYKKKYIMLKNKIKNENKII